MNLEDALSLPGLFRSYCSEPSCACTVQSSGVWERTAEERGQLAGFWVFLLKDYEVWHDKMATGFKSNRTFILLYDYKWLGVKMSPFISTASYLGSVWFML